LDILKNVLRNIGEAKKGASLFGAFKGVPALICGGGASLEANGALLQEWKDKALLFSGGAGLNVLCRWGIKPHFAAGIDPNPSLDRFWDQNAFESCFFYQSRFNAEQLSFWQGERLWIEGSGGFPAEEWLFSSTPFDGGWNVATFLTRIAYELGCNPIILCGVDLGSKNKKLYAEGVKETEEESVELNGLYTKKDWIMAADWLSRFAETHSDVVWINSSDGLKFRGFSAKNLKEIELPPAGDLEGLIHTEMQNANLLKQDLGRWDLLRESFNKTSQLCGQLLQVMEKYFPEPPQEKGDYILLEVELEAELAYQKFLLPVWNVWKYILQREIEPNVPKAYGIDVHRVLFMMRVSDEAKQISS
ncbi:MAG TPA: 6-hydroxymethylpterin diphosphokinase MptE-like protein, partial [Rhabdochlamydiaceae bacterium]|nr:6-hydroxymethylpterin diphosphokinase MptE-like protein [Rhabdochlamydiaceae bacterium]